MKNFTGFEYLLIDVANHYGLDKLKFEERIQWATTHLHLLEERAEDVKPKDKPMYIKAVMAVRDAQAGIPSGHLVGFDGVCSGIQMMSVLTGCIDGARATGLVDPNRRADAYSDVTSLMQGELGSSYHVSRDDAKSALMKSFYGSRKVPKELFGEDTPEINAFYKAATTLAPGAWELLQILLASWNAWTLCHSWKLPDGYDAVVKVMVAKTDKNGNSPRIEVDELNHASFTYQYEANEGTATGLSNAANLVHSVDAYVLRNIHRRCNYDREMVETVELRLIGEYSLRQQGLSQQQACDPGETMLAYYLEQFDRSTMADPVIFPYVTSTGVKALSDKHLATLHQIATSMLKYQPFEVVTIH